MNNKLLDSKKLSTGYFLPVLLLYGILSFVNMKFISSYSNIISYFYKDYDVDRKIITMTLLIAFIITGLVIKGYGSKLQFIGRLLVLMGLILQGVYIYKHATTFLHYKITILYLFASITVSLWASFLFVKYDSKSMWEVPRNRINTIIVYYALEALMLLVAILAIHTYYARQISTILSAGSTTIAGGLSSVQMEHMIHDKLQHVDSAIVIAFIVMSFAYLLVYKKKILGSL